MDDPVFPWFVFLAFPAALLLIIAFAALLVWGMRRKPEGGLGLRVEPDAGGTPRLLGGTWNAMIHAESVFGSMGGTAGAVHGRLELTGGTLRFVPDDASGTPWSAPAAQLTATRGLARPVRLDGPMGTVHLTASHEHVNRWSRNSLKSMRELRYADELISALEAYGARRG